MSDPPPIERRQYRRIQAQLYCRPAGVKLLARHHEAIDVSLGGVRIYSDEEYARGSLLKMELFTAEGDSQTYTAEVVWIESLPAGGPALFDVGLRFVDLRPDALALLSGLLGPEGS
jgi:PilZ domain